MFLCHLVRSSHLSSFVNRQFLSAVSRSRTSSSFASSLERRVLWNSSGKVAKALESAAAADSKGARGSFVFIDAKRSIFLPIRRARTTDPPVAHCLLVAMNYPFSRRTQELRAHEDVLCAMQFLPSFDCIRLIQTQVRARINECFYYFETINSDPGHAVNFNRPSFGNEVCKIISQLIFQNP